MFPRLVKLRAHFGFVLCSVGFVLGMLSLAATPPPPQTRQLAAKSSNNRHVINGYPGPITGKKANQGLASSQAAAAWSLVASPNNSSSLDNQLTGVTCASASECWAIGTNVGDSSQTFIEQWNGTAWTIVPSPNPSPMQQDFFNGVTCASTSECWAVGYYNNGTADQTLIEEWNGSSWSIVTSANTGITQDNLLDAVTCASASDCWAVGVYSSGQGFQPQTLTEHWDGTSWTIVTSPSPSAVTNYLNGVTCTSSSDCWAVGYYSAGNNADQTLIEQWNGTSWAIVSSPNTSATQLDYLASVTCASASQCWAVGYYQDTQGSYQTLIEQWNGSAWSIVTSPNASTDDNFLNSVACVAGSQCWAVGYYSDDQTDYTLIERWNGTSWAIITSPNANDPNYLYGVACASASECWAVGSAGSETLIEEYTANPLQITSVSGPSNGHFTIMGQSPPSIPINIEVSPDLLTPFATFTTVTSDANGFFEYDDGSAGMVSQRFYEASYQ